MMVGLDVFDIDGGSMKVGIEFSDKEAKFKKTLNLDFKDEHEAYLWAEKQKEIWDKSGKYKKLKWKVIKEPVLEVK
jgi:hypothetical protein